MLAWLLPSSLPESDDDVFFCAAVPSPAPRNPPRLPLELFNLLKNFHEAVNLFLSVVDVETGSCAELQLEDLMQRLRTVVSATYHNAIVIQEERIVVAA